MKTNVGEVRRSGNSDSRGVGTGGSLLWAALLVVAALVPGPAVEAQSVRRVYQDGLEALKQNNPEEAIRLLQQAIKLDGEEKKRLGFRASEPYLPYYYLGESRFFLGDCKGALAAWDKSLAQGVVRSLGELQVLQRKSAVCRNREEVATLVVGARSALQAAETAAEQVREVIDDPELAEFLQGVGLEERLVAADQSLNKARTDLAAGAEREDQQLVRGAGAAAQTATAAIAAIGEDAEGYLEQRRDEIDARISALHAGAVRTLRQTDHLDPIPAQIFETRQILAGLIETATLPGGSQSLGELVRLAGQLQSVAGRLERLAAPPSRVLLEAAEAFLGGDYAGTLDVPLAANVSAREAAHGHLLRAAAMFSLAALAGDEDEESGVDAAAVAGEEAVEETVEEAAGVGGEETGEDAVREPAVAGEDTGDDPFAAARDEILQCRLADESLVPVESVFSPRFIAFFAETVAEDAAPVEGDDPVER